MKSLQRQRGLRADPDLTGIDEEHALRYKTADWTDLLHRHPQDVEQILERLSTRFATFEELFNRKLKWVFIRNNAERQTLKAQAARGGKKKGDPEESPAHKKSKKEKT